MLIQFNSQAAEDITLAVYNAAGQLVVRKEPGLSNAGLNYATFNGGDFPSGFYTVELKDKSQACGRGVIKVN